MVNTTLIKAEDGDKDKCPKCGGKVFEAEKISSGSFAYHRLCFTCTECSRGLDSFTCCSGPNKALMCSNCYIKLYGPNIQNFKQEVSMKLLQGMLVESRDPKVGCQRYLSKQFC